MAHNSRYERIAQEDDAVSLQTVSQDYNYNSGVPNSPPPSFRSTTTPLTPATLRSLNATCADPTPPYPSTNAPSELRGGGGDLPDPGAWSGTAVEAPPSTAATIMSLHTRIARLEESLGRLLLERESWARDAEMAGDPSNPHNHRSNCCANLPDDHASLRTRNNCCVNAVPRVSLEAQERRQKKILVFTFLLAFLACLFTWLIVNTERRSRNH